MRRQDICPRIAANVRVSTDETPRRAFARILVLSLATSVGPSCQTARQENKPLTDFEIYQADNIAELDLRTIAYGGRSSSITPVEEQAAQMLRERGYDVIELDPGTIGEEDGIEQRGERALALGADALLAAGSGFEPAIRLYGLSPWELVASVQPQVVADGAASSGSGWLYSGWLARLKPDPERAAAVASQLVGLLPRNGEGGDRQAIERYRRLVLSAPGAPWEARAWMLRSGRSRWLELFDQLRDLDLDPLLAERVAAYRSELDAQEWQADRYLGDRDLRHQLDLLARGTHCTVIVSSEPTGQSVRYVKTIDAKKGLYTDMNSTTQTAPVEIEKAKYVFESFDPATDTVTGRKKDVICTSDALIRIAIPAITPEESYAPREGALESE